jgi:hypothetical protein
MENSGLQIRNIGVNEEMEYVRRWLRDLQTHNDKLASSPLQEKVKADPVTPPRRWITRKTYEEVSPTDTSFSGASIFDIPFHNNKRVNSPSPHDRFYGNISDVSSLDDDFKIPDKHICQPNFVSSPASFSSYDPSSALEDGSVHEIPSTCKAHSQGPYPQRIVTILSCLQCTLAGLHCSRSTPSCARCIRNGSADTCVLLRRRFAEEVGHSVPESCNLPILLKCADEDTGSWKKKMKAADDLKEVWQDRQDKKNWVLPPIESCKRSGYRVIGYVAPKIYRGVGWGWVRCEELIVDRETILD